MPERQAIGAESVGLPPRVFLYTLDQIAYMLDLKEERLRIVYCWWEAREPGAQPPDKLAARNIAPEGETPDWRVTETELVRWMKRKRFKFHVRGWSVR